jgi:hypothetical protein
MLVPIDAGLRRNVRKDYLLTKHWQIAINFSQHSFPTSKAQTLLSIHRGHIFGHVAGGTFSHVIIL